MNTYVYCTQYGPSDISVDAAWLPLFLPEAALSSEPFADAAYLPRHDALLLALHHRPWGACSSRCSKGLGESLSKGLAVIGIWVFRVPSYFPAWTGGTAGRNLVAR